MDRIPNARRQSIHPVETQPRARNDETERSPGSADTTAHARRTGARRSTTRRPRRATAIHARSGSSRVPRARQLMRKGRHAAAPGRHAGAQLLPVHCVPSSEGKDHTRSTAGFTKMEESVLARSEQTPTAPLDDEGQPRTVHGTPPPLPVRADGAGADLWLAV